MRNCITIVAYAGMIAGQLLFSLPSSYAQEEKTVPASKAEMSFSFAPVVKKAAPAVVNIHTRTRVRVSQNISPFMGDPFFRQFFDPGFQFGGRTQEQVITSLGSGVIIQPDGMIVTSYHVIKDAQEITVVLADKQEFEAKITIKDSQSDLAFLKISATETLPHLELRDSDSLEVGDLVLAIGNPFGIGQTVTNGIISGLARKAVGVSDYQFFIQTDAAINPGNSGGALVDMKGRLVGINTAIYSTSGGSNGIGFAIPANMVRSLQGGKIEGGRVVRPWLGIAVQPVTSDIAESMGLTKPQGIIIKQLYPGSPAEKSGLKTGDIITQLNGIAIDSEQDLHYRLALTKIGDTATFTVIRAGQPTSFTIALIAPPELPKRDERTLKGRHPLNGITVANMSPALAMELGLDEGINGVTVIANAANAGGMTVGFMPGDVFLEINGKKVTSVEQLETLLKTNTREWRIAYRRGDNVTTLAIRM